MTANTLLPLPDFNTLHPAQVQPALDAALDANRRELAALLAQTPQGWDALMPALDDMSERVARVWGPVQHLFGVKATPEWREAFNAALPKITAYGLELSQSQPLFRAYEALSQQPEFAQYSRARRKVVTDALRDFRLSGIALPQAQQARYKQIALRLSELQAKFEEHLMDAIAAWSLHLTDATRLRGMNADAVQAAADKARAKGLDGWLLTLDFPSYDAVITYAADRGLREQLYQAYATRASDQGPQAGQFDNTPLMTEILALRHEQSQLLGFSDYAHYSFATKMAESPAEVERFLLDLAQRARPRALAELAALKNIARERDGLEDFQPWDASYYAEKLKEQQLGLSDEMLKPYFPAAQVIEGLFTLVQRLYGIRIEAVDGLSTWHADVRTYALKDARGARFGLFYLDPYAREHKRSGAWMDECLIRRRSAQGVQQPAAYLTCNFTPPLPGQPALLTHDEVVTLFHEFGHGLHHLLTQVDEAAVSGIRGVAWDAVELPSQFMENWCFDPATLRELARHHQTGASMPEDLIARLRASRSFLSGLATLRQVEFALFDLRLHVNPAAGVLATLARVRDEVAVTQPPSWNRMPCSFGHIFAGGYAAGYYSYKWAEVLSADAFAAFEESGFAAETGARFRDTVLAQGGSREAMELFMEFRGRKPSIEPLLRQSGLLEVP